MHPFSMNGYVAAGNQYPNNKYYSGCAGQGINSRYRMVSPYQIGGVNLGVTGTLTVYMPFWNTAFQSYSNEFSRYQCPFTVTGSPSYVHDGLQFTADGQYITINASITGSIGQGITDYIVMWIRSDAVNGPGTAIMGCDVYNPGAGSGLAFFANDATHANQMNFDSLGSGQHVHVAGAHNGDGLWHCYIMSHDPTTHKCRLYVDGGATYQTGGEGCTYSDWVPGTGIVTIGGYNLFGTGMTGFSRITVGEIAWYTLHCMSFVAPNATQVQEDFDYHRRFYGV